MACNGSWRRRAQTAEAPNIQNTPSKNSQAIPWDQIGAKAGAEYHGDGLSVAATAGGARLHCAFQRLDGEATVEGLWLVSTGSNAPGDRFRVVATAVGREVQSPKSKVQSQSGSAGTVGLPGRGTVTVAGQTVRFTRAGLVEEYSVSMDGVQQDFVVPEKPAGEGRLEVQLAVSGTRVEPAADGAQLVLEQSGRKIAYSRLRVTDANGKELPARMEVGRALRCAPTEIHDEEGTSGAHGVRALPAEVVVVVDDAGAVYPVRIDPTFSDANWLPLGSGMNGAVRALAVSGGNLYAGGAFTTAGGKATPTTSRNGTEAVGRALGSGMNGAVRALAVSGSTSVCRRLFHDGGRHRRPITSRNGTGAVGRRWVRG